MRVLRMTKAARIKARIGVSQYAHSGQGSSMWRPITNPMIVVHRNISASENCSFMPASLPPAQRKSPLANCSRVRAEQFIGKWSGGQRAARILPPTIMERQHQLSSTKKARQGHRGPTATLQALGGGGLAARR